MGVAGFSYLADLAKNDPVTHVVMRLDVQQERRNHRNRFLPRDVSLQRPPSNVVSATKDTPNLVITTTRLTISVSPTKKLWNTLYSGLFLIVLLGTFNCQANCPGYHSSCLGAGWVSPSSTTFCSMGVKVVVMWSLID